MYFADAWMGERADRNFPSRTKDFWAFEPLQHSSSPSFLFNTGNRHSAPTEHQRPSSHGGSDAVAEAHSLRRRTALIHPRLVPGALSSILSSLFIRPNTRSASGNAHVEFRPFPAARAFTKGASTLLLNHITLLCIKTGVFRVCFRTPDITTQYSQMRLDPESL